MFNKILPVLEPVTMTTLSRGIFTIGNEGEPPIVNLFLYKRITLYTDLYKSPIIPCSQLQRLLS